MTPIHTTLYSPVIVQHPFTTSGITAVNGKDRFETVDITSSNDALNEWRAYVRKCIDRAEDAYGVYILVTKPYALTFLKYAEPHLSRKDFSKILADAWVRSENPNCDVNVGKRNLVAFFKQSDPSELMSAQERRQLSKLDDIVTIYRGVTSYNAENVRALSWTLDYEKAKWFAHRFSGDGTVYEAQIKREDILALFNSRNESEVIVDPKNLTEITEAQIKTPTYNFTQSM